MIDPRLRILIVEDEYRSKTLCQADAHRSSPISVLVCRCDSRYKHSVCFGSFRRDTFGLVVDMGSHDWFCIGSILLSSYLSFNPESSARTRVAIDRHTIPYSAFNFSAARPLRST
jgi:hypothetical protein